MCVAILSGNERTEPMYHLFLLEPDGDWTYLRSHTDFAAVQRDVKWYERLRLIVEWIGW